MNSKIANTIEWASAHGFPVLVLDNCETVLYLTNSSCCEYKFGEPLRYYRKKYFYERISKNLLTDE